MTFNKKSWLSFIPRDMYTTSVSVNIHFPYEKCK